MVTNKGDITKMKTFYERVYAITKQVPRGSVTSYRDIAHALNSKAYRAVGTAMNKNPYAPKVPCHRVINSSGKLGGFAHGLKKKIAMLKKEGVTITNNRVDLKKFGHRLKKEKGSAKLHQ